MKSGSEVCVTVTLLDGLVLARSLFHHSMNYRSVVIMGQPQVHTPLSFLSFLHACPVNLIQLQLRMQTTVIGTSGTTNTTCKSFHCLQSPFTQIPCLLLCIILSMHTNMTGTIWYVHTTMQYRTFASYIALVSPNAPGMSCYPKHELSQIHGSIAYQPSTCISSFVATITTFWISCCFCWEQPFCCQLLLSCSLTAALHSICMRSAKRYTNFFGVYSHPRRDANIMSRIGYAVRLMLHCPYVSLCPIL